MKGQPLPYIKHMAINCNSNPETTLSRCISLMVSVMIKNFADGSPVFSIDQGSDETKDTILSDKCDYLILILKDQFESIKAIFINSLLKCYHQNFQYIEYYVTSMSTIPHAWMSERYCPLGTKGGPQSPHNVC